MATYSRFHDLDFLATKGWRALTHQRDNAVDTLADRVTGWEGLQNLAAGLTRKDVASPSAGGACSAQDVGETLATCVRDRMLFGATIELAHHVQVSGAIRSRAAFSRRFASDKAA